MLKVNEIYSGYGKLQILNGISIEAKPQEITVIIGPNGSGKSTLLKTVCGLTQIYGGTITLNGKTLSGMAPHEIAKHGVAYLPQTQNVFVNFTILENLRMAAYTLNNQEYPTRLKEVLGAFPKLTEYSHAKASNLSGGERQMLAMAAALIRRPEVMMFDEPTGSLAPKLANQVLSIISSLAHEAKLTVLLAEQNAKRALEIGDRAYLLVSGAKAFEGKARELLEHPDLGKLYLGAKSKPA